MTYPPIKSGWDTNCVLPVWRDYDWYILILGCNGGDACCKPSNQCDAGEGNCNNDNVCKGNLLCGNNNCVGSTFDSTDDCCA